MKVRAKYTCKGHCGKHKQIDERYTWHFFFPLFGNLFPGPGEGVISQTMSEIVSIKTTLLQSFYGKLQECN